MAYQCKAMVINCMDFRFHTAIRDFLVSLGLKDQYDLVSFAGSIKDIVNDHDGSRGLLLEQIGLSLKLHAISDLYLIQHMDCGAYGGHSAFPNKEEEWNHQIGELESAKKYIEHYTKTPDLSIHKVMGRIDQDGRIDFEIIE